MVVVVVVWRKGERGALTLVNQSHPTAAAAKSQVRGRDALWWQYFLAL